MKKKLISLAVLSSSLFLTGCGSSGGAADATTSSSSTSSTFSGIPSATGEVSSSALVAGLSIQPLATSGVILAQAGQDTFESGDSTAFCENTSMIKDVINNVAQPGSITCYLGVMENQGILANADTGGDYAYLKITNMGNQGDEESSNGEPLIKYKLTKTDGVVTEFEMFSCFSGTTASPEQSEYISTTIDSGTASVVSKYSGGEGTATYGSSGTASGSYDTSSNVWTSKELTGTTYYNDTSDSSSYNMSLTMNQLNDYLTSTGYQKGSFGGGSFANAFYTAVQLIGADSMPTLALGDGSSKYSLDYAGADDDTTGTDSWNADTREDLSSAADGDYFSTVTSQDLSTIIASMPSTPAAITFTSAQTWDCSLPTGQTWQELDFDDGDANLDTQFEACTTANSLSWDYVSCNETH